MNSPIRLVNGKTLLDTSVLTRTAARQLLNSLNIPGNLPCSGRLKVASLPSGVALGVNKICTNLFVVVTYMNGKVGTRYSIYDMATGEHLAHTYSNETAVTIQKNMRGLVSVFRSNQLG